MNLRSLAILASFAVVALTQSAADACGVPEPEDTIARHFNALNAHDRTRLLSQWNDGATVVSLGDPMLIEPVSTAASRWVQTKEPVTFHVDKIDEGEGTATAHVTVNFEGRKLEDTMLLTAAHGTWHIAGKTSRVIQTTGRVAMRY
jgi:hypothetical protein